MRCHASLVMLFMMLIAVSAYGEDWRQFRGPSGDGQANVQNLPDSWGGSFEPPVWSTGLPGIGWSSPIVVDGRIWLTASEPTALSEEDRENRLAGERYQKDAFEADASVKLFALEVDAASGRLLRRIDLADIKDPKPIHSANSYASPTPVSDGQRVYCHFGSLGTFAVAIDTGAIVWQRRFEVDDITGSGASPVLCDGLLILVRDGSDAQYVVALNGQTGEEVWRRERPETEVADDFLRRGFSTPLIVATPRGKQLIAPTANWVVAYDPGAGDELWRASFAEGHAVVPRPVYANGIVYVCSGYHKASLAAIRVDGSGDVSDSHVLWTYDKQVPLVSSPVVANGQLYFVSDNGVITCLNAITGEPIWRDRIEGSYAASPLFADGKLYFTSSGGLTTVIRPGAEFDLVAENKVFGRTMASLAIAGDAILIRTSSKLYAFRKQTE